MSVLDARHVLSLGKRNTHPINTTLLVEPIPINLLLYRHKRAVVFDTVSQHSPALISGVRRADLKHIPIANNHHPRCAVRAELI